MNLKGVLNAGRPESSKGGTTVSEADPETSAIQAEVFPLTDGKKVRR